MRILRLLILMVLVGGTVISWAQPMTEQQAKERALQYLSNSTLARARGMNVASKVQSAKSAHIEAMKIFAFNLDGGGYVIASGDQRALPVLGYSHQGSIDWQNMPDNMRAWLQQYDEAITAFNYRNDFVDGNRNGQTTTRSVHPAIEPLIKSKWYQTAPYSNDCPIYDGANPDWVGKRGVSGCVATAMAQVMNYWQWPKTQVDGFPAYEYVTAFENTEKVCYVDSLPPVSFDWDNMLDEYTKNETAEHNKAVSTLMRYCGQAVKTQYTPNASSARSKNMFKALKENFGYPSVTWVSPHYIFGIDEWEEIVYNELAASRPVLYCGNTNDEGHAFICDGYDGNGLFHINWGWRGDNDGYFSLSVLNPHNNTSTGSSKSGIGYSINQRMVIGIDPHLAVAPDVYAGKPQYYQFYDIGTDEDNTVVFYISCYDLAEDSLIIDYAMGTHDADGKLTPRFWGNPNDSILGELNYMPVAIDTTAFEPGEHLDLYPMFRIRHAASPEWLSIAPDTAHAVVGRKDDGEFYISTPRTYSISVVSAVITRGSGREAERNDITVTFKNNLSSEYVGELGIVPFYYGHVPIDSISSYEPSEGDISWCGAYLRANQESDVTFEFKPLRGGLVKFGVYNGASEYVDSFLMEFADSVDTSIRALDYSKEAATVDAKSTRYYDLQGRYLNSLPHRKGIYIRNRRKIVIH